MFLWRVNSGTLLGAAEMERGTHCPHGAHAPKTQGTTKRATAGSGGEPTTQSRRSPGAAAAPHAHFKASAGAESIPSVSMLMGTLAYRYVSSLLLPRDRKSTRVNSS